MSPNPQKPESNNFIRDCERVNAQEQAALEVALLMLIARTRQVLLQRMKSLDISVPSFPSVDKHSRFSDRVLRERVKLVALRGAFLVGLGRCDLSPRDLEIILMDGSPLLAPLPLDFLSGVAKAKIHRTATMTPEQYEKKVGEKIAEMRLSKKWSRQQLADAIGMTVQSVGRLETGRQRVASTVLYLIADALGLHLRQLLPKKTDQPGKLPVVQEILLKKAAHLAEIRALDTEMARLRRKSKG